MKFEGEILEIPEGINLEGGNIIVDGDRIFVGVGIRTTEEAVDFLNSHFGNKYKIIPVKLSEKEEILHLDAVFNIIGENYALLYEEGIDNYGELNNILGKYKLLRVTKDEKQRGACNIFSVNGKVLLVRKGLSRIVNLLKEDGFECYEIPWDETLKTGTVGPRCAILPLCRLQKDSMPIGFDVFYISARLVLSKVTDFISGLPRDVSSKINISATS